MDITKRNRLIQQLSTQPEPQLARIARRHDVEAIYAQIAELDPGDDCWPFSDTVYVVGTIRPDELEAELSALQPDEVVSAEASQVPAALARKPSSAVLLAWWD